MLPPDVVRWTSVGLLVPFVAVYVGDARFGTGRRRASLGRVRVSRPPRPAAGRFSDVLQLYAAVALLLEIAVPEWVYGGALTLGFPTAGTVQVTGVAAWLLSLVLVVWSIRHLGAYGWGPTAVYEDHRLISSGPYRRIRHPLYAAMLLMNAGAAMFLLNPILVALLVLTYASVRRMALEEETLLASPDGFGDAYRTYMRRTGRFLPRFGSRR